jgi:putative aminopeptidase FrvX
MMSIVETLRELTAVAAPSGRETPMAEKVKALWRAYGPVTEDRIGNLSVTVGEGDSHVALVAHMDEVGFVVRQIRDDGFIGLNRLGGIPERVLAGQRIRLLGREGPVTGLFATYPHHLTPDSEKYRVRPIGEVWVDVGCANAAEVAAVGLRVGDFAVYERSWHATGRRLFANALDDRVGLAAMTAMLEHLAGNVAGRVTAIASVQEEFSIRALVPTVRRLDPDALVVVDICPATDTPEMAGYADIVLGRGPVLNLHSFHGRGTLGGVLPPEWLVEAVEAAAAGGGVNLQRASVVGVITDGAFAQHLNDGIPTVEIGVPVRYTHGPVEACAVSDIEDLVALLGAMPLEIAERLPWR